MNLLLRLLWLLLTSRWRPQQGLMETATLRMRVLPSDLDLNRHLTNSRYLSFMDLGRTELMLRTGLLRPVMQRRWLPVVSTTSLRFRREIGPFERFHLNTRLLGWDEKWFYMEQRFETQKGVAAVGVVKGLFKGAEGPVPTEKLLALVGHDLPTSRTPLLDMIDEFEQQLTQSAQKK